MKFTPSLRLWSKFNGRSKKKPHLERVTEEVMPAFQLEEGGNGMFSEELRRKGIWKVTVCEFQRARGLEESGKGGRLDQLRQCSLPYEHGCRA